MIDLNSKVQQYVQKRKTDSKYTGGQLGLKVVLDLFQKYNSSTDIEQVLLKVAVLNDLYHTHLTAPVKMAKHIVALKDLDTLLQRGSSLAVKEISKITMPRTADLDIYIFATKYCFMSNPLSYFIYDPIVRRQLVKYLKLSLEEAEKLKDYDFFSDQMKCFIRKYNITASHTDLDTFLWLEGHEENSHL